MAFSSFTSALATTGPKLVTAKKFIHNIVRENNFESLFWLLAGRKMSDILQGGSEIRSRVKFSSGSQADFYDIGATEFTPGVSQDGAYVTSYWHGLMAYDGYYEEVVEINAGGDGMDDTITETWTQEMHNMMQSLYTKLHQVMAYSIWRPADPANMGSQGYKYPNSIPSFLTEHPGAPATHGGATSGSTRYGLFNTGTAQWRTIHGIDVPTTPNFIPYIQAYGTGDKGFEPGNPNNVIFAIDMAVMKTTFRAPPVNRDYFQADAEGSVDQSGGCIFSSAKGVSGLRWLYQNSQDRWGDWMDPYGQPKYHTIPVCYEYQLDVMPLYSDGSTGLATESTADIVGARYYGVNARYTRLYFKKNRFMKMLAPKNDIKNPTYWAQYVNSLMSMQCTDRKKNFIVYPAADQTVLP